jgi:acyl-CoA synthetase (AMP-forming)/AMP-acid ligase II
VQCMPLYHSSAAVLGVSCTLGLGATICIGKKFSARTFWPDVRASKATIIQYVGETCRYLLSAPVQYGPDGENLDKKNNVRVAFGNGLRPDVWDRFKERFDIEGIAEFYSATEGHGSLWNFSRNSFSKGAIGRNGTLGYLLNRKAIAIVEVDHDTGAPLRDAKTGFCMKVPWGEPGEALWKLNDDIASQFQGYYGNSAATDSKIMRDVLVKGDVYYRSGDMIRWDKERTYFSDRIGDTFRWKSENVSTNQVSESLGNHPAVEEANVYGEHGHDGYKQAAKACC